MGQFDRYNPKFPFTGATRAADRKRLLAAIVTTIGDSVLGLALLLRSGAEDLEGHPTGPTLPASLQIVGGWTGRVAVAGPASFTGSPEPMCSTRHAALPPRPTAARLGKRCRTGAPPLPKSTESRMQPTELVAVMAAIIYSGRRTVGEPPTDAQAAAVSEAWQLWHLTLEHWTDFGERQFQEPGSGA
jgi:hypothetical protein